MRWLWVAVFVTGCGCDFSYNDFRPRLPAEEGDSAIASDSSHEQNVGLLRDAPGKDVSKDVELDVSKDGMYDIHLDVSFEVSGGALEAAWHIDPPFLFRVGIPFETEVTQDQFYAFVRSGKGEPSSCGPVGTPPASFWTQPVTCVTWHQANSYCEWVGAALCSGQEWMNGCSSYGLNEGCVGTAQESRKACNTQEAVTITGKSALASTKAYPKCKTPIGQFDMVGNVSEWTATCSGTDCLVQGGSFEASSGRCEEVALVSKNTTSSLVGFRCCSATGN